LNVCYGLNSKSRNKVAAFAGIPSFRMAKTKKK